LKILLAIHFASVRLDSFLQHSKHQSNSLAGNHNNPKLLLLLLLPRCILYLHLHLFPTLMLARTNHCSKA
jgi:hypothetical protein